MDYSAVEETKAAQKKLKRRAQAAARKARPPQQPKKKKPRLVSESDQEEKDLPIQDEPPEKKARPVTRDHQQQPGGEGVETRMEQPEEGQNRTTDKVQRTGRAGAKDATVSPLLTAVADK